MHNKSMMQQVYICHAQQVYLQLPRSNQALVKLMRTLSREDLIVCTWKRHGGGGHQAHVRQVIHVQQICIEAATAEACWIGDVVVAQACATSKLSQEK
jgi:hypothetical protein